jgi:hypothetical protein
MFGLKDSSGSIIADCYTLVSVPGKSIKKSFGLVQFVKKGVAGDIHSESEGIFNGLVDVAKTAGANAVINIRLTSGTYQQQGSGWNTTYVIACGEAVTLV